MDGKHWQSYSKKRWKKVLNKEEYLTFGITRTYLDDSFDAAVENIVLAQKMQNNGKEKIITKGKIIMRCSEVKPGSYDCVYSIMPPYKCGMLDKIYRYVSIDKCLVHEIIHLWEQDIKTVGCCCGHGDVTKAYIQVQEEYIPKMIELGYVEYFNIHHPLIHDCFIPKTVLAPTFLYGEAKTNKVEEQQTKNQKGE